LSVLTERNSMTGIATKKTKFVSPLMPASLNSGVRAKR
jgi:hypothetical protein